MLEKWRSFVICTNVKLKICFKEKIVGFIDIFIWISTDDQSIVMTFLLHILRFSEGFAKYTELCIFYDFIINN